MTPKTLLRKLESTRKAYSKLWDRLESLEEDIDEAEQQDPPVVLDLTGWGVSEMRDGLGFAIGNLDDAIKEVKKLIKHKK